jgi:hypothetical protein
MILSRNKTNEAVVTKPPTETQVAWINPFEARVTQTKKTEKTEEKIPTRENEKTIEGFSLENELKKIKIPMTLVEIAKNPIYKKKIAKMINFSDVECHADVITIQDERPTIMF